MTHSDPPSDHPDVSGFSSVQADDPRRSEREDLPLQDVGITRYCGWLDAAHSGPELLDLLQNLPEALAGPTSELLYRKRNRVYRIPDPASTEAPGLCVKAFRRPGLLRSLVYRRQGSKAQRAYRYAAHLSRNGAAVATPIACVERWRGPWLVESYLVTHFLTDASDLYSELNYVLRRQPELDAVLALLKVSAEAIRSMHDNGFLHGDLGPQNLLVNRTGPAEWANPTFIDLNRGRLTPNPGWTERARDFQRMKLPSRLLAHFLVLYCRDQAPPEALIRGVKRQQKRFRRHQRTRRWRHPVQTLVQWFNRNSPPLEQEVSTGRPPEQDVWLWDTRAEVPAQVLESNDQKRYRRRTDVLERRVWRLRTAWSRYQRAQHLQSALYQQPVAMANRVGVTLELDDHLEQQLQQIARLPGVPVRLRVHFRRGANHWQAVAPLVRRLRAKNHRVTVAVMHSRSLVTAPGDWQNWLRYLRRSLPSDCGLEILPAPEQPEYGLWTHAELQRMQASALGAARRPEGPLWSRLTPGWSRALGEQAGVHSTVPKLMLQSVGVPEAVRVGRRPRSIEQVLCRWLAQFPEAERLTLSSVDWALQGTGRDSPLAGGYFPEGADPTQRDPHVSEAEVARYLVRLALLTLCSGTVNEIYWSALAHPGTGLIDPRHGWRERPAWQALEEWHKRLAGETFHHYSVDTEVHWWCFTQLRIVYTFRPCRLELPRGRHAVDLYGRPLVPEDGAISLDESPVYLI